MENRDRDKVSRNVHGTAAGDVNRETSAEIGKQNSGSSAEFGQNIGRSEHLNEPNRKSGTETETHEDRDETARIGEGGRTGSSSGRH